MPNTNIFVLETVFVFEKINFFRNSASSYFPGQMSLRIFTELLRNPHVRLKRFSISLVVMGKFLFSLGRILNGDSCRDKPEQGLSLHSMRASRILWEALSSVLASVAAINHPLVLQIIFECRDWKDEGELESYPEEGERLPKTTLTYKFMTLPKKNDTKGLLLYFGSIQKTPGAMWFATIKWIWSTRHCFCKHWRFHYGTLFTLILLWARWTYITE